MEIFVEIENAYNKLYSRKVINEIENVLIDMFETGYKKANAGIKFLLSTSLEVVVVEMIYHGTL